MNSKLFLIFILLTITLCAQSGTDKSYSVNGTIIDDTLKTPLPGATIVAIDSTMRVIAGTISDTGGRFKLSGIPSHVRINIALLGYFSADIDTLHYYKKRADIGVVRLKTMNFTIQEIVIKGEKPLVEYYVDKQVINVDRLKGHEGHGLLEGLVMAGFVFLDNINKDNIIVHGQKNVKILIDGKPLPNAGDLANNMPMNAVDQVEIMSVPSAKQDAEGEGGIINIIPKHSLGDYFNGSISITASTQKNTRGNVFINFKKNNYNIFLTAYGSQNDLRLTSSGNSFNNNILAPYHATFSGNNSSVLNNGSVNLGVDYDFDTLNSATISVLYSPSKSSISGESSSIYDFDYGQADYSNILLSSQDIHSKTLSTTGFYRRRFSKPGKEFTTDIFFTRMLTDNAGSVNTLNSFSPNPDLQNDKTHLTNYTFIINSDFVNPLESSGKYEAGYKYTYRDRKTDYNTLVYDYTNAAWRDTGSFSNVFHYKEGILAAYCTYANKVGVFSYKLGVRSEYTDVKGVVETTGNEFRHSYVDVFPTGNIAYQITPMIQAVLSATRRITRPQMEFINPFIKLNGRYSAFMGNANLMPMYMSRFELAVNPYATFYYSAGKGKPQQIAINMPNGRLLSTYANLSTVKIYGGDLTIPLSKWALPVIEYPSWWNMANITVSYQKVLENGNASYKDLSELYDINKEVWQINSYCSFQLASNTQMTIGYRISPKFTDVREVRYTTSSLLASINQNFFDNKLSVSLSGYNLLNGENQKSDFYGSTYSSHSVFSIDRSRNVSLSINWKFNDYKFRQERKVDDGRDR